MFGVESSHLLGFVDKHRLEYSGGVMQIFLQRFGGDFAALQLSQQATESVGGHETYILLTAHSSIVAHKSCGTHLEAALSQASGVSTAGKLSVVRSTTDDDGPSAACVEAVTIVATVVSEAAGGDARERPDADDCIASNGSLK